MRKNKNIVIKLIFILMVICLINLTLVSCGDNYIVEINVEIDGQMQTLEIGRYRYFYINNIPEKEGYEFTGWFDAKIGGVQYANKDGLSLAPYMDENGVTLYPQYKTKEYTVFFDYDKISDINNRHIIIKYNEWLKGVPLVQGGEHEVFTGWYTEKNQQGTKISNGDGTLLEGISLADILDENADSKNVIHLYPGFEPNKVKITLYIDGYVPEEYDVPWGIHVNLLSNYLGLEVSSWSKIPNSSLQQDKFNGVIIDEIILYANQGIE